MKKSVKIDASLHRKIKVFASQNEVKISEMIDLILIEFLDSKELQSIVIKSLNEYRGG